MASTNAKSSLATGEWIRRSQNLLITGATGSGKTWTACALAQQTCRQGNSVAVLACAAAHRGTTLSKVSLIVLDELGLTALSAQGRADLLEVLDDRVNTGSTVVVVSCLWKPGHAYLGDPTLADAILDRLAHQSHRIELKVPGESMRKPRAGGRLSRDMVDGS